MAAGTLDLVVEQGTTFNQVLVWQDNAGNPINLTGYTARMQARTTVASTTILIDATTENGRILLGGVNGQITLVFPATYTATLVFDKAVYDLELASAGGVVTRLVKGSVTLDLEVTRS